MIILTHDRLINNKSIMHVDPFIIDILNESNNIVITNGRQQDSDH